MIYVHALDSLTAMCAESLPYGVCLMTGRLLAASRLAAFQPVEERRLTYSLVLISNSTMMHSHCAPSYFVLARPLKATVDHIWSDKVAYEKML